MALRLAVARVVRVVDRHGANGAISGCRRYFGARRFTEFLLFIMACVLFSFSFLRGQPLRDPSIASTTTAVMATSSRRQRAAAVQQQQKETQLPGVCSSRAVRSEEHMSKLGAPWAVLRTFWKAAGCFQKFLEGALLYSDCHF